MAEERKKTVIGALAANAVIAVAKYLVAAITGSAAILSEAIHSTVDTGNEVILLVGQRRSKRPADRAHPFGHGLEAYFWTLIVAILLFGIGGGMSIYEGVTHLVKPPKTESPLWSYLVLGVAFAAEGISWSIAYRALKKTKPRGTTLWQGIRGHKDPQVVAVFLEDSAALAGIVFAATGVTLSHVLHEPKWDGVAAVLIGLTLCGVAALLAAETRKLLIGEAADDQTVNRIWKELAGQPEVEHVERPLTMHFGPEEVLVNLEVKFKPEISGRQLARAIAQMEKTVRALEPRAKRVFVEAQALQ